MKSYFSNIAKIFVPLAFTLTVLAGMIYLVEQQNFRMNADDPQIQLAEDFASQLSAGRTVASINTSNTVDMAKSLSLFIIIYDSTGNIVASTGKLNGQSPTLPNGVLDYAKKVGQNKITWQPETGLRFAVVIMPYNGTQSGFVAVGRSLREVEQRITRLGWQVLGIWLIGLIGLLALMVGIEIFLSRRAIQ